MTTQRTIRNAVAYVGITGRKRHLNINTCIAIFDYVELNTARYHVGYELTAAGQELVKTCKLWKAHQYLTDRGFRVERYAKHSTQFIRYVHDDGRSAFTGKHGSVYITPADRWSSDLVAEFTNG